jgi:hypothetical protein
MYTTAQGGRLKTQSNQGARQRCAPHSAVVQQCGRLSLQRLSGPTVVVLPDLVTSVCAASCACHNVVAFGLRHSASVFVQNMKRSSCEKKSYIVIAIPGRASATPCKQGNKQTFVLFHVSGKGQWQKDGCKFYQGSNNCQLSSTIAPAIVCKPSDFTQPEYRLRGNGILTSAQGSPLAVRAGNRGQGKATAYMFWTREQQI